MAKKRNPDTKWKKGGDKKKNRYRLMAALGGSLKDAASSYAKTSGEERAKTQNLKDKLKKKGLKSFRKQSKIGNSDA